MLNIIAKKKNICNSYDSSLIFAAQAAPINQEITQEKIGKGQEKYTCTKICKKNQPY